MICEFCGDNCEGYVCKNHDIVLEHELETLRANLRRETIGLTMEEQGLRPLVTNNHAKGRKRVNYVSRRDKQGGNVQ